MYVIKVGDYYVKEVDVAFGGFINDIVLSKEIMKNFKLEGAKRVAELINGEIIEIPEEVTNDNND